MKSTAIAVDAYAQMVPADRRDTIAALIKLIRKNMPEGYEEAMTWGMPTWQIPLSTFSKTYNGKPLMYAALASQKNHMALYLMAPYAIPGRQEAFEQAWKATGKRLDMGKSCVRFKSLENLPLDVIAAEISSVTPAMYLKAYKAVKG